MTTPANTLYYGDNLDILRRYVKDESVDLVYLDPPFNSNADYNVLFAEHPEAKSLAAAEKSHAQIQAFKDTWTWNHQAALDFTEAIKKGGPHVANCMMAFRTLLGASDMLAYLSMMAPRLLELRRALKATGSIYLHCDPTASHYLKLLMDAVFTPQNFLSEIAWKRTSAHSSSKRWGPVHDILLLYTKSAEFVWNDVYTDYSEEYVENFYRYSDDKGRFRVGDLTGAGTRSGDSGKPWKNVDPTSVGRHWAVPNKILKELFPDEHGQWTVQQKLDALDQAKLIFWPAKGKVPGFKRYLESQKGTLITDVITDIAPIGAKAAERLGYPTQKPEALLERILKASSNPGDTVLDPFCGCGTTIAAAQKLNRRWIGIDITHLAVNLIKIRLADSFGKKIAGTYKVVGEPTDLESAKTLADDNKYQFQYWALGLIGARPAASQEKKGADKGIDGRLYITDENGDVKSIIISVKGGHVSVPQLRDLRGVIERENAAIGVFISLEDFTKPMRQEAADAGFYENKSPVGQSQHPRLQLLTINDLLNGKRLDLPLQQDLRSFKQAPRTKSISKKNLSLKFDEGDSD